MQTALPFSDFLELRAIAFVLVFTRVSGIFVFAPIFSAPTIPGRFKVLVAFAIAVLLTGVVPAGSIEIRTMVDLVLAALGEILVGFILGNFLQMIFQALQLAGQTAGQQLGLSLANVVNPQFDEQTSTTSVIYATVASLAFFGIGAHRELFAALLETFDFLPLGGVFLADSGEESARDLALVVFHQSMIFAVRVAAPATVCLLLAELALGFIGRTVPQLNILSVGFSIRIILGLFITMTSLTGSVDVFLEHLGSALGLAYEALADLVPEADS